MKAIPCGAKRVLRFRTFRHAVARVSGKLSRIITAGSMLMSALVLDRLERGLPVPDVGHQNIWYLVFRSVTTPRPKPVRQNAFRPPKPSPSLKRLREASPEVRPLKFLRLHDLKREESLLALKTVRKREEKTRELKERQMMQRDVARLLPLLKLPLTPAQGLIPSLLDEARRAASNTLTSLRETFYSRIRRVVGAQLKQSVEEVKDATAEEKRKAHGMLRTNTVRSICGWDLTKQDFLEERRWAGALSLSEDVVLQHQRQMPELQKRLFKERIDYTFLPYLFWLHTRTPTKRSFSILPQFRPKARFITVSLNTLPSFVRELGPRSLEWFPPDILDKVSKTWRGESKIPPELRDTTRLLNFLKKHPGAAGRLWTYLFRVPRMPKKKRESLCTRLVTDGISLRLFIKTNEGERKKPRDKDSPPSCFNLSDIKKGTVVTAKDDLVLTDHDLDFVFVDPGHKDLISAVRVSEPGPELRGPRPSRGRALRRFRRQQVQSREGVRTFSLSNRHYRTQTYSKQSAQVLNRARRKFKMEKVWSDLRSPKVNSLSCYMLYVATVVQNWERIFEFVFLSFQRFLRLRRFQSTQSSGSKLVKSLRSSLGIRKEAKVALVWGAGSFQPTLRGHDSAPNKALVRRMLPHVHTVIYTSEHMTSQLCPCCGERSLKAGRDANGSALRGLRHCKTCGKVWNRDTMAALNIRIRFWARVRC